MPVGSVYEFKMEKRSNFKNIFNKMLIRYREKDSRMPNWIELPVNPPNARKIQIHNLSAGTTYEFQVIGINDYGDGMMSQIVEARTKGRCYTRI